MSRKWNGNKGVKRSTMLTITAILFLALFLPACMGAMSSWNDWIADHNGRMFMVRTAADLITVDAEEPENETFRADAIWYAMNESDEMVTIPLDFTWGNTTNLGYHSFVFDGDNSGSGNESSILYIRLNVTALQMRENNTVQWNLDAAGFGGANITCDMQLHPADEVFDPSNLVYLSETLEYMVCDNDTVVTFDSISQSCTFLDLVTAEDSIGDNGQNAYLVMCIYTDGVDTFIEGEECYIRIYDTSLNTFGTINTEAGYTFTLFLIGVFLAMTAVVATPFVNFMGPSLRDAVRKRPGNNNHNFNRKKFKGRY